MPSWYNSFDYLLKYFLLLIYLKKLLGNTIFYNNMYKYVYYVIKWFYWKILIFFTYFNIYDLKLKRSSSTAFIIIIFLFGWVTTTLIIDYNIQQLLVIISFDETKSILDVKTINCLIPSNNVNM